MVREEGYGRRADIWSLGCTIIEMASGVPPWANVGTNQFTVMMKIANGKDPPQIPSKLSQEAQSFMLQCFQRNPAERPNAKELLVNSWIKQEGASSRLGDGECKHWPDNSTAE